jgi:3-oxoadipate enol-lactonase
MEAKFVEIKKPHKITLEYSVLGRGNPFVFLHGGGVNHYEYSRFLEGVGKYYQVYTFTYPGFLGSTKMKNLNIENYLIVVKEFVDHFKLQNFIIAGQSFGGGLTLAFAAKHPELVKMAVAVTPLMSPINKNVIKTQLDINKSSKDSKQKIPIEHQLKDKRSMVDLLLKPKNTLELIRIQRVANKFDIRDQIKTLKMPTLVFVGENDVVLDPDSQIQNAKTIPNVKLYTYKDHGHYLISSKTDEIIEKIVEND